MLVMAGCHVATQGSAPQSANLTIRSNEWSSTLISLDHLYINMVHLYLTSGINSDNHIIFKSAFTTRAWTNNVIKGLRVSGTQSHI